MSRKPKIATRNMFKTIAILIRNTTWKCGRIERLVIKYLQTRVRKNGKSWSNIKDMIQHFNFKGKQKSEFFDALRRL